MKSKFLPRLNIYHGGWFSPRDSQLLDQAKPALITSVKHESVQPKKHTHRQSSLDFLLRNKSLSSLQTPKGPLLEESTAAPTVSLVKLKRNIFDRHPIESFQDIDGVTAFQRLSSKETGSPHGIGLSANTEQILNHLNRVNLDKITEKRLKKKINKERFKELFNVLSTQKYNKKQ